MFLNYLALAMIFVSCLIIFYGLLYIHELPYEAAKHRNHPQQDAIYAACWLSLFTVHALWPLVFIWALSHKESEETSEATDQLSPDLSHPIKQQIEQLSDRLKRLEKSSAAAPAAAAKGRRK